MKSCCLMIAIQSTALFGGVLWEESFAQQRRVTTEAEGTSAGEKTVTNSIGMKLLLIPAGEFMMGNTHRVEEDVAAFGRPYGVDVFPDRWLKDEYPRHRVRITESFYLGAYELTVGQFRRFIEDTGYKTDSEKGSIKGAIGWDSEKASFPFKATYSWRNVGFPQTDEHPVVNVSWNDAVAFCEWLSRKEHAVYRLPTEAEWEYACRSGTVTRYCSGDDPEKLFQVGNVDDATAKAEFPGFKHGIRASDGHVFTAPVGQFRSNTLGLFDMHGNVREWCSDWYARDYYAMSPLDDPSGPNSGEYRVVRGGSWFDCAWDAMSAFRMMCGPDYRSFESGFRVAKTRSSGSSRDSTKSGKSGDRTSGDTYRFW